MKLSTKGRYGLRAMIDLALHFDHEAVSISSQSLSESYLEQLMSKLKKAGLVKSVRGAQGGYLPAKPADKISVGDILRALEGDLRPVDCPGILGECSGEDSCVTKYVWKRISDSINETVDNIFLSALVEQSKKCGGSQQCDL